MTGYFKKIKKSFLLPLIAAAILSACNSSGKTPPDDEASDSGTPGGDWVSLFDGKTFRGWHTYGADNIGNAWKVEDSTMHLTVSAKNGWQTVGGGDLVTNENYTNFDLRLEWKISPGGNSGIFFYVHEDIDRFKNPNQSGLEMQINDDPNNKNGTIEKQRNGDLVGLLSSSSSKIARPAGQWNEVEIRSDRGKLNFFMNGQNVLSTTLWDDNWEDLIENSKFKKMEDYGTFKKGRIALQDHGSDVWFRNIRIRKL
jgi:hypothetical protein